MKLIGLTGSIAMGKSYAARAFAAEGAPTFDADRAVHRLMAPGGAAVEAVASAFPGVEDPRGGIDRGALGARVFGDRAALAALERIVHPAVRRERRLQLGRWRMQGRPVALLDVPLLFETGGDRPLDATVVVSAPASIQRRRALARPGMTERRLRAILEQQMLDAKKRSRADFVFWSGGDRGRARAQAKAILKEVLEGRRERCEKSCSTPRPPASNRTKAIAWSRSARSS